MFEFIIGILCIVFMYLLYDIVKYFRKESKRKNKQNDDIDFLEWL